MTGKQMLDNLMIKEIGIKWIVSGAGHNVITMAIKKLDFDKATELINKLEKEEELHPDVIKYIRLAISK